MPVYNADKYLAEALASIFNQNLEDFEVIAVDDGSTDESANILRSFQANDTRLKVIRQERRGVVGALNSGLQAATGAFIARMDADDVCLPYRLERQVAFLTKNPEISICSSWYETFGCGRTSVIKLKVTAEGAAVDTLFSCPLCHPAVMMRREALVRHELRYSDRYPHAEDYELWSRIVGILQFANIPEVLLRHREHTSQITHTSALEMRADSMSIRKELLSKIGIECSDRELCLHQIICECSSCSSPETLHQAAHWLCKILSKNAEAELLPSEELSRQISDRWYALCNSSVGKIFSAWRIYTAYPALRNSRMWRVKAVRILAKGFVLRFLPGLDTTGASRRGIDEHGAQLR